VLVIRCFPYACNPQKGIVNLLPVDMINEPEGARRPESSAYEAVGRLVMSCQVWNLCPIS
jgi:hypothetical protein